MASLFGSHHMRSPRNLQTSIDEMLTRIKQHPWLMMLMFVTILVSHKGGNPGCCAQHPPIRGWVPLRSGLLCSGNRGLQTAP